MSPTVLIVALSALIALHASCRAQGPEISEAFQTVALIEEPLKIPSVAPGVFGARSFQLDALVIRPQTAGKLPLAIITHGTPRIAADRRNIRISSFRRLARDFARRGWAAAIVIRRGHGASEGEYEEGVSCGAPDYVFAGRVASLDLSSSMAHLSTLPYVDPTRILGVGHSTGGFSWLAASAKQPPNLVGVVNFAGGHGSLRPNENCSEARMLEAMRAFGADSRAPTLWIYSENDGYTGPDLARRMHREFTAAGGDADLKIIPAFETEGHDVALSASAAHLWSPALDAFLRGHALPTWPASPSAAAPALTAAGREHFNRYLAMSSEKAFALSMDGAFDWWWSGQESLDEAKRKALERCENGVRKCRVFAVNNALAP